jgi:hypothetical protein
MIDENTLAKANKLAEVCVKRWKYRCSSIDVRADYSGQPLPDLVRIF